MDDRLADILDDCLEQLRQGATQDECLGRYPEQRAELEPLLRSARLVVDLPMPTMPAVARAAIEQRLLARVAAPRNLTAPSARPPIWANPAVLIIAVVALLVLVVVLVAALVAVIMQRGPAPTPIPIPRATALSTAVTTPGAIPTQTAMPTQAQPALSPTLGAQTPTAPGLRNVLTPLPSAPSATTTPSGGLRNEPIITAVPPTAAPPPPPGDTGGGNGGNGDNGDTGGDQNCQGHQNGRDDPKCDRDDDKKDGKDKDKGDDD